MFHQELSDMDLEFSSVLYILISLISVIPIIGFYLSYKRVRDRGLLITMCAFGLFMLKGLLLFLKFFIEGFDDQIWLSIVAIFDLLIIISFTFPLLKRIKEANFTERDEDTNEK